MTVSKIDLLNKQFSRSMLGYSRMEVDQFMLELAEVLGDAADSQKGMRKKSSDWRIPYRNIVSVMKLCVTRL